MIDIDDLMKRMNETGKGETICLNHDECEALLILLEEREERIDIMSEGIGCEDPSDAEVMITHNDGSVEYLKDVDSIGLISSKHFEITCYCELNDVRPRFVKDGDPE